ncbi:pimeloyl-ACP methyl ester carboxylesterase [Herbihabitans rhizosphaerae]|uniref:Pimeloyl-ACP methyl ester carboxylesterase n=1 Tax=Herbihabitans rhizosphaerae TaxID=1872711 RepID=A0A4Q7KK21_9PSEU|nr:alpha/beta hydrolase [Herbihabitans rhizosphaerae]RZS36554.1 pimeloyl-ACP methyl ester carboxylesterase [Herbihabitans rhizosphaerae]
MNRKIARVVVAAVVLMFLTSNSAVAAPTGQWETRCTAHRLAGERIHGELCFRGRLTADTPIQILLHGGTYDRAYWDWPYEPRRYSYVENATRRGFATLNLDRLGYGGSDHPDPTTLDFTAGADAVHQVIDEVRGGALGPSFTTVVLNGHSMGGIVALNAAARGGADAVIVSGIPRNPETRGNTASTDPLFPFYPAEQDPKFAGNGWAPGYLTTRPGTRMDAFHYPGTYEPAIARLEESLKDTLTVAELCSLRPCGSAPPRQQATAPATVPVLHVLGRNDMMFCRTTGDCATDPGAGDTEHLIDGSGHSINLSRGAPEFYRLTFRWLTRQGIAPSRSAG